MSIDIMNDTPRLCKGKFISLRNAPKKRGMKYYTTPDGRKGETESKKPYITMKFDIASVKNNMKIETGTIQPVQK